MTLIARHELDQAMELDVEIHEYPNGDRVICFTSGCGPAHLYPDTLADALQWLRTQGMTIV